MLMKELVSGGENDGIQLIFRLKNQYVSALHVKREGDGYTQLVYQHTKFYIRSTNPNPDLGPITTSSSRTFVSI
jgi:hypothetical protein